MDYVTNRYANVTTAGVSRRMFLMGAVGLHLLDAQEQPTFSVGVNVVNVLSTVRTKKGEIVRDLTKEFFTVFENGRPQNVTYFSRETDLPLTLGLMVDTSMSQRKLIATERAASGRFLEQVLRPQDRIFIMQFDMGVQLKQEPTASFRALDEALSYVDTPTRRELQGQMGGGTLLYDAIVEASKNIMVSKKGRKALVLLTDGVDTGSEATVDDAIDAAQWADVLIYSILFSDSSAYPFAILGPGGRQILTRLSKETGGSMFEVKKSMTLDQIYARIQDELRSEYNLGFVSDVPVRNSEFRKLQVTVKQRDLVVQARDRYWARR